ncbi:MAG TPA: type II secretion system F family protein [Actinomycetota bacterium]|nr:type II secretion system F family protein [Actinomycetota bacterium]
MTDVVVAALGGISLVVMVGAWWAMRRSREASRLLDRLAVEAAEKPRRAPGGPLLEGWAVRVAGTRWGGRLEARAAAHHPGVPFSDALAVGLVAFLGGWLFALFLFGSSGWAVLAAAASPWAVDRFYLRLHGNRAARIEKQLPEALALQASVLRAGQSLGRSLRVMAEETKAPLREELERLLSEVDFGRPMDEGLERLSARVPSKDLDMWVTAMLVHRQTGGNLAGVIESSASRISQRLQLRSEVKAMTAQGRLSGLVVAIAPIAFFLLLSVGSREQMEFLFSTAMGLAILAAGLTMNALGMLWIRHALRIRSS